MHRIHSLTLKMADNRPVVVDNSIERGGGKQHCTRWTGPSGRHLGYSHRAGPSPPVLIGNGTTGTRGGQGAIRLDEGAASLDTAFQLADNSAGALWVGSSALFTNDLLANADSGALVECACGA